MPKTKGDFQAYPSIYLPHTVKYRANYPVAATSRVLVKTGIPSRPLPNNLPSKYGTYTAEITA